MEEIDKLTHEFPCPYCQRACALVKTVKTGQIDSFHKAPTCSSYDNMKKVDFMHAALDAARAKVQEKIYQESKVKQ